MIADRTGLCAAALFSLALFGGTGCQSTPDTPEERAVESVKFYKDGVALIESGRLDQGIELLEKATAAQPSYVLLRWDLARVLLRRALQTDVRAMNAAEAVKAAKREQDVETRRRKEFEVRETRRLAVQDFQNALSHLLFVEPQLPGEANVAYCLSQAYTGLGEYEMALESLRMALSTGEPALRFRKDIEHAAEILEQLVRRDQD